MEHWQVGFIAGVIIVFAISIVDRLKLDDPEEAIGVHLVCGIFETLALGIMGDKRIINTYSFNQLGIQAYGVLVTSITY